MLGRPKVQRVATASRRASKRTLFSSPAALGGGELLSAFTSSTLLELLTEAGIAAEATSWFETQDVDYDMATELSLAELQQLVGERTTMGKVRRLHTLLMSERLRRRERHAQEAASRSQWVSLKPTATTPWSRAGGASRLRAPARMLCLLTTKYHFLDYTHRNDSDDAIPFQQHNISAWQSQMINL